MDAMAALGALAVTDGNAGALLVTAQMGPPVHQAQAAPGWTAQDRNSVDTVFVTHTRDDQAHPILAALVATACISAAKGLAIDESRSEEDEDREDEVEDEGQPRPGR